MAPNWKHGEECNLFDTSQEFRLFLSLTLLLSWQEKSCSYLRLEFLFCVCPVFAYGATGAGKTHTMLGTCDTPGVMFLTMKELFARMEQTKEDKVFDIAFSYLEVRFSTDMKQQCAFIHKVTNWISFSPFLNSMISLRVWCADWISSALLHMKQYEKSVLLCSEQLGFRILTRTGL